jgi:NADH dehydrogenase FAD-containing subunit
MLDPTDEIVLVERRPTFVMGLRKSWALVGNSDLATGERRLDRLAQRGITVLPGEIEAIEPTSRAVVFGGRRLAGDAMIVALGAARLPATIPGFSEHHNVYDRH